MKNFAQYIIDYTEGNLSNADRIKFETELIQNKDLKDEYELFLLVNEVMQGNIDIEEINAETSLSNVDEQTKQMIVEFKKEPSKYKSIQNFVENSLYEEEQKIEKEINLITKEINENKVDDITKTWVKDWDNSQTGNASLKHKEVIHFVSSSLSDENNKSKAIVEPKITWYKNSAVKIVSIAAAASLVLIFVVRSLLIPSNPENLYETNYKPYEAFTSITRGADDDLTNRYNQAIVNYRQGNYELAAMEFEMIMKSDTFSSAPKFFAGLSQIELGDYAKAINLLNNVVQNNADYATEAKWYLGLTYIKTGDNNKAIPYFKDLSQTPGYYQREAKKMVKKLR
ncbi:hypothetical protein CYCD_04010 [Tenuifilaceae bacterium CYCD]|nr:hypothetical protein CYCD_04010 [Tenuifilaceae bacterium CYCD]